MSSRLKNLHLPDNINSVLQGSLLLLLSLSFQVSMAQTPVDSMGKKTQLVVDSILPISQSPADSAKKNTLVVSDTIQKISLAPVDTAHKVHSVKRATNLSAILPGAGQIYNHKVWKVPILYAAFGGMVYLIKFNNDHYKDFNSALITRLDGDSTTIDKYSGRYTDANLQTLSDYYHRNRDLSIIVTALIYVLNIIDAHVDAHLYTFDVNDNLSLQVSPTLLRTSDPHFASVAGINLNLRF